MNDNENGFKFILFYFHKTINIYYINKAMKVTIGSK